ncbi:hypothetical protein AEGHOMDF_1469 [Methylobacterium soli]|nr:hypothetical protein AEGHOMDF_1469 [Methylobacterium soli]
MGVPGRAPAVMPRIAPGRADLAITRVDAWIGGTRREPRLSRPLVS